MLYENKIITRNEYVKIKNNIILEAYPFAFEGPCASLSGPGVLANLIKKKCCIPIPKVYNQKYNESSYEYLCNMLRRIMMGKTNKRIYLGGNHLTALPMHLYAREKGIVSIIFDAHLDCKKDQTANNVVENYQKCDDFLKRHYNHSNFLNAFPDLSELYVYGCRDTKSQTTKGCHVYLPSQKKKFLNDISDLIDNGTKFYLDLDVDAFSPAFFSATACPIDDGIMIDDLYEIIHYIGYDNIEMFSIEEYIPLIDNGMCGNYLVDIILEFIKSWISI